MNKHYTAILIVAMLSSPFCQADDEHQFDVKELIEMKKISSLEFILHKLSSHDIDRLLEVELKRDTSRLINQQYIYEIEYINDKGIILEIEVDAVTAQVLKTEREY
ncbi:MAG: hypothetical protein QNL62_14585 [Gammaproteobacteria bacterium]|nr:hypothetical protein [Gammaproteobacteria bacterium]